MRRVLYLLTLTAALAVAWSAPALAQAPAPAPPAAWTAADCEACHDKAATPAFQHSKHAGLEQSCASCHPNVAEHVKAQSAGDTTGPVPSMKKLAPDAVNAICLSCHEKANQANWHSSMHDRRKVACTSCHGIHDYTSVKAQLKTKTDTETCVTCHKPERSKSFRTSHHPVREGKMSCASCHNPHDGSRPKLLKADSVNELCYTCHTEKRGPFLFEHAPVREDCVACHEPHGSNHRRLLTKKLPNLCWDCHFSGSGHFGSGDNLTTEQGARVAPVAGFPTVSSRFVERACKNCHINVHGSNHPSGAFFVR